MSKIFLDTAEKVALKSWHECTDALLAAYLLHNPRKLPSETSVIELLEWSQRRQRELGPTVNDSALS